ncbi:MAG TPA: radical SAM/SPASM domain-containing protein [Betaproteobacteria bacterium]|nr:radical SAM/SPASM domain-containing protein [Betaproteobacteria bacterium]
MKLSDYHIVSPPFFDKTLNTAKRVIFSARTAQARTLDEAAWQFLETRRFHELPSPMVDELREIEFIVPKEEDELRLVLDRHDQAAHADPALYLVVQPTAWCQLACDYCGQSHTRRQLSPTHQARFIAEAQEKLAAHPYRYLQVSWFGAEPLVGMSIIRRMTPQFQALAEQFGVRYGSKIVTNGMLLRPDIATELIQSLGVKHIEVTLDGVGEAHDARRPTKKGQHSFERIFANVAALAKRDDLEVELSIRCNVDRRNRDSISPLLRRLAAEGVQRRVLFYVAPVHSWGNDAHRESLTAEEFAQWELQWFAEMIELEFRLRVLPGLKKAVCMSVSPTSTLIDANGELFNCTEASYVPAYGNPNRYAIGAIAHGEQPGKREQLSQFNTHIRQGEYACHSCRMLPVCGGCCPKLWKEDISPCPMPKYNIENRLLLQYCLSRQQQTAH